MKGKFFFSLSLNETEYHNNFRKKWVDVIKAIPASEGDIDEAGKCFALGRYAASVFHSLQVVEIGIIELGKAVGATDHQTGWNATTKALEIIIKKNIRTAAILKSCILVSLSRYTQQLKG